VVIGGSGYDDVAFHNIGILIFDIVTDPRNAEVVTDCSISLAHVAEMTDYEDANIFHFLTPKL